MLHFLKLLLSPSASVVQLVVKPFIWLSQFFGRRGAMAAAMIPPAPSMPRVSPMLPVQPVVLRMLRFFKRLSTLLLTQLLPRLLRHKFMLLPIPASLLGLILYKKLKQKVKSKDKEIAHSTKASEITVVSSNKNRNFYKKKMASPLRRATSLPMESVLIVYDGDFLKKKSVSQAVLVVDVPDLLKNSTSNTNNTIDDFNAVTVNSTVKLPDLIISGFSVNQSLSDKSLNLSELERNHTLAGMMPRQFDDTHKFNALLLLIPLLIFCANFYRKKLTTVTIENKIETLVENTVQEATFQSNDSLTAVTSFQITTAEQNVETTASVISDGHNIQNFDFADKFIEKMKRSLVAKKDNTPIFLLLIQDTLQWCEDSMKAGLLLAAPEAQRELKAMFDQKQALDSKKIYSHLYTLLHATAFAKHQKKENFHSLSTYYRNAGKILCELRAIDLDGVIYQNIFESILQENFFKDIKQEKLTLEQFFAYKKTSPSRKTQEASSDTGQKNDEILSSFQAFIWSEIYNSSAITFAVLEQQRRIEAVCAHALYMICFKKTEKAATRVQQALVVMAVKDYVQKDYVQRYTSAPFTDAISLLAMSVNHKNDKEIVLFKSKDVQKREQQFCLDLYHSVVPFNDNPIDANAQNKYQERFLNQTMWEYLLTLQVRLNNDQQAYDTQCEQSEVQSKLSGISVSSKSMQKFMPQNISNEIVNEIVKIIWHSYVPNVELTENSAAFILKNFANVFQLDNEKSGVIQLLHRAFDYLCGLLPAVNSSSNHSYFLFNAKAADVQPSDEYRKLIAYVKPDASTAPHIFARYCEYFCSLISKNSPYVMKSYEIDFILNHIKFLYEYNVGQELPKNLSSVSQKGSRTTSFSSITVSIAGDQLNKNTMSAPTPDSIFELSMEACLDKIAPSNRYDNYTALYLVDRKWEKQLEKLEEKVNHGKLSPNEVSLHQDRLPRNVQGNYILFKTKPGGKSGNQSIKQRIEALSTAASQNTKKQKQGSSASSIFSSLSTGSNHNTKRQESSVVSAVSFK